MPHAGWYFSGRLAFSVLKCMSLGPSPDTLLIFGHHLRQDSENILMPQGGFETPLGDLMVDEEMGLALAKEFTFQLESINRYYPDNTIELQLPLIKYIWPNTNILPIGLPPRKDSLKIASRAVEIGKGLKRNLKVLGSTDLTHYGYNYGFLPKGTGKAAVNWVKEVNDRAFIDAVLGLDPEAVIKEGVFHHNACCSGAAAAAVKASLDLGANKARLIGYYTSYDVMENDSFVGYGGIVLYQEGS